MAHLHAFSYLHPTPLGSPSSSYSKFVYYPFSFVCSRSDISKIQNFHHKTFLILFEYSFFQRAKGGNNRASTFHRTIFVTFHGERMGFLRVGQRVTIWFALSQAILSLFFSKSIVSDIDKQKGPRTDKSWIPVLNSTRKQYDICVVGAGLSGSVIAERYASQLR